MNCYGPDREETIDRILCNRCRRLREGITCAAFPKGIPMEILRSGAHFLPVPGDHGIVFEEKTMIPIPNINKANDITGQ